MLQKLVGEDEKLTVKSKVDLAGLPPCRGSLIPHLQRVNYRTACHKRAYQPIFWKPKPYEDDQGWEKTENETLEPVWSYKPVLHQSLTDILESMDDMTGDLEDDDVMLDTDDLLEYLDESVDETY